ncbi:hypothetical protein [Paenibacillus oleatilyticus]|uniref:Uncharacterized protein n=1 Tax=Paenibacillus oleatilyticus TaxID=2594886 RepID=A0ABV4VB82_9BACL
MEKADLDVQQRIINEFGRLDIELEEDLSRFQVYLIDIYNSALDKDAARNHISYERHNLFYEQQFLKFFEKVFSQNNNLVYIYPQDTGILKRDKIHRGYSKSELTLLESLLSHRKTLFTVDDLDELNLVVKLSIREILLSNFFFSDSVIIGNFDLTFPVYFFPFSNFNEKYYSIANDVGLHLRN